MNTEDKQKLNEKIAKWLFGKDAVVSFFYDGERMIVRPNMNGFIVYTGEVFTDSMDAILKEIVPELIKKGYEIEIRIYPNLKGLRSVNFISKIDFTLFSGIDNESLPMAFCLALEKYIDSEGKVE